MIRRNSTFLQISVAKYINIYLLEKIVLPLKFLRLIKRFSLFMKMIERNHSIFSSPSHSQIRSIIDFFFFVLSQVAPAVIFLLFLLCLLCCELLPLFNNHFVFYNHSFKDCFRRELFSESPELLCRSRRSCRKLHVSPVSGISHSLSNTQCSPSVSISTISCLHLLLLFFGAIIRPILNL